jgi:hypothetical protein
MDVVVQRAVERIEEHDTPEFRKRALNLFEEARAAGDAETTAALLGQLGALLKRGASEDKALDRLADTAERLARRQEKAWGIKLDAATALNARDLMAVLARFADIVLEEVPKDAAARVIRRIDGEIVGTGPAAAGLQIGDPA